MIRVVAILAVAVCLAAMPEVAEAYTFTVCVTNQSSASLSMNVDTGGPCFNGTVSSGQTAEACTFYLSCPSPSCFIVVGSIDWGLNTSSGLATTAIEVPDWGDPYIYDSTASNGWEMPTMQTSRVCGSSRSTTDYYITAVFQ